MTCRRDRTQFLLPVSVRIAVCSGINRLVKMSAVPPDQSFDNTSSEYWSTVLQ